MKILYDPPNVGTVVRRPLVRGDYLPQEQGPPTQRVNPAPPIGNEGVRRRQEKRRAPRWMVGNLIDITI